MEVSEEGELLFFEDRTPGNASNRGSIPVRVEPRDFISFTPDTTDSPLSPDISEQGRDAPNFNYPKCDETDQTNEDTLRFIEDRSPILTGKEPPSPKYKISVHFQNRVEKPKPKRNKLSNTCWNCGETTHSLRDCPEPRNHARIARCRKEFQDSRGQVQYRRYHVDDGQVFGHLQPGQLSSGLRRALGLDERQLPRHIYNMRRLGYPPGWLLEAKVSHSGIAMFDGQGNEVNDPNTEVGEVVEEGSLDKYDIRKIVQYPGFNVPPPPGTYDDSAYWRCPPQSYQQSIDVMLARLGGKIVGGYKRKKLAPSATISNPCEASTSAGSQEMEYEEIPEGRELPEDHCKFVPPLPDQDLPPPPPMELPTETDTDLDQSVLPADEPSLTDLEEAKKRLLAELNDTTPICGTPESRVGKVKSVDLGTPLLKSVSPYSRLPSAEKFSVNICDVINFENLPNSTGKYEQMSGIIKKVRSKLSKMNEDL